MSNAEISDVFLSRNKIDSIVNNLKNGSTIGIELGIDEKASDALYSLGYGYFQQNNYEEAIKYFEYAFSINHYDRRSLVAIGKCFKFLKNFGKAIDCLTLAQIYEPSDPIAAVDIAECLIYLRKFSEAKNLLILINNEFGKLESCKEAVDRSNALLQFIEKSFNS